MQTHDLKVRLSTDLKDRLQSIAQANDRSMNGELTQILKAHFGLKAPAKKVLKKAAKGAS